jgi:repressor LexA
MDYPQSTGPDPSPPVHQTVADIFRLPRRLVGDDDALFLLKMYGSSMIDAEIIDGDWAIVRQRPVAESGEIVAAVIDQEVTIKRFKRINKQIWLMPENLAHIPVPGNEATILGKVVAVLRWSLLVYASEPKNP